MEVNVAMVVGLDVVVHVVVVGQIVVTGVTVDIDSRVSFTVKMMRMLHIAYIPYGN